MVQGYFKPHFMPRSFSKTMIKFFLCIIQFIKPLPIFAIERQIIKFIKLFSFFYFMK